MHILDFPPEITHQILIHAITTRVTPFSCARALRLKLVCKQFHLAFQPALFESRKLGDCAATDHLQYWYIRVCHGAEKLWHSYLTYMVRNETDATVGRFVEIGDIASRIRDQVPGTDHDATIDALCWLALERGSNSPNHRRGWVSRGEREDEAPNPDLNLLSAAAYLGHAGLARRLLRAGHCPTQDNDLFPCAVQAAAWAGNMDMLRLLQEHLAESAHQQSGGYAGSHPNAIKGAALRGDVNMVRLILRRSSRVTPDDANSGNQSPDQVEALLFGPVPGALWNARSWEVFECMREFFQDDPLKKYGARLLAHYAELGNVEIVGGLLDAGVDIYGREQHNCNPLIVAARFCHEEVVDLLLERGADPNHCERQQRGSALCAAAAGGSLALVRKLVDRGARPMDWVGWTLKHAVLAENEEMVRLLLERGLTEPSNRLYALRAASDEGLESMVEFMHRIKVD